MFRFFPLEILHAVCSLLNPYDLFRLCLTCQILAGIARKHLYKEISIKLWKSVNIETTFRLLISDPSLARCVKRIRLDGSIGEMFYPGNSIQLEQLVIDALKFMTQLNELRLTRNPFPRHHASALTALLDDGRLRIEGLQIDDTISLHWTDAIQQCNLKEFSLEPGILILPDHVLDTDCKCF